MGLWLFGVSGYRSFGFLFGLWFLFLVQAIDPRNMNHYSNHKNLAGLEPAKPLLKAEDLFRMKARLKKGSLLKAMGEKKTVA